MKSLKIPKAILNEIQAHVDRTLSAEACGLLGGQQGLVSVHIPVNNILNSPNQFRMHPEEQLLGLIQLEENGLDLLAIYHSHPHGTANPSPTDLDSHLYPEAAAVILAWEGIWIIKAFEIIKGFARQIEWMETA
jgi:proteasome lid subunit RPN8/RPN11